MIKKIYANLISNLEEKIVGELSVYLSELRSEASNLYISLTNNKVDVDYSSHKAQIAYVIRYLPIYWEPTARALQLIDDYQTPHDVDGEHSYFLNTERPNLLLDQSNISVGILGAGPAPEALGVLNSLRGSPYSIDKTYQEIEFDLYDEEPNWRFIRDIIFSDKTNFFLNHYLFNLKSLSQDKKLGKRKYDLLILQNCLNEFIYKIDEKIFLENLDYMIDHLKVFGYLIITDRYFDTDHGGISSTMELIKTWIELREKSQDDSRLVSFKEKIHFKFEKTEIPKILSKNFFNNQMNRMIATQNNWYTQIIIEKCPRSSYYELDNE